MRKVAPAAYDKAGRPFGLGECPMIETLNAITNLRTPFNMIVLVVLISCAAGIVTTLFKELRKFACHRQELNLKRDLVERGLSVEEIERVIAAKKALV
jgi:hypothetical protein